MGFKTFFSPIRDFDPIHLVAHHDVITLLRGSRSLCQKFFLWGANFGECLIMWGRSNVCYVSHKEKIKHLIPESFWETNSDPQPGKLLQAANTHHRLHFKCFATEVDDHNRTNVNVSVARLSVKHMYSLTRGGGGGGNLCFHAFALPQFWRNTFTCRNIIRTGTFAQ